MSAPMLIIDCINDINIHLLPKSKNTFPLHIPAMGNRGGSGCNITRVDIRTGEIEIEYKKKRFSIFQKEYNILRDRFNALDSSGWILNDGRPEKYGVSRYNRNIWHDSPLGRYRNPLLPSIFKELGY